MTTQIQDVAQSRIGKRPLALPDGVQCSIQGNHVAVKGPKGELARELPAQVQVTLEGKILMVVPRSGTGKAGKQFQGLARALLESMVEGTSKGFTQSMDLRGVGYRAAFEGSTLTMSLGLSHPVVFRLPTSISVRIETIDEGGIKMPRVHLSSHDKEALGQAAARIRSFRPPEPYKGKGVRYTGERIREKAGKTGGKK